MDDSPPVSVPSVPHARRLELAYLDVFGTETARSGHQRLVMADIEAHCYAHRLVSEGETTGDIAIHRALFNDGRRSVWLRIRGQIIRAATPTKTFKISREKIQPKK